MGGREFDDRKKKKENTAEHRNPYGGGGTEVGGTQVLTGRTFTRGTGGEDFGEWSEKRRNDKTNATKQNQISKDSCGRRKRLGAKDYKRVWADLYIDKEFGGAVQVTV